MSDSYSVHYQFYLIFDKFHDFLSKSNAFQNIVPIFLSRLQTVSGVATQLYSLRLDFELSPIPQVGTRPESENRLIYHPLGTNYCSKVGLCAYYPPLCPGTGGGGVVSIV